MFELRIILTGDSASALARSHSRLQLFKAVRNSDAAGQVVLWYAGEVTGPILSVAWQPGYQAYASRSTNDPPDLSPLPVGLGQILTVSDAAGTATVTGGGSPGVITIQNSTTEQFQAGLAQAAQAVQPAQAFCSFPLYGGSTQLFTPVEQVVLRFSTGSLMPGQRLPDAGATGPLAANLALSGALLVDMAGAPDNIREVHFDINGGWSAEQAVWATAVAPGALRSVLLLPDA